MKICLGTKIATKNSVLLRYYDLVQYCNSVINYGSSLFFILEGIIMGIIYVYYIYIIYINMVLTLLSFKDQRRPLH